MTHALLKQPDRPQLVCSSHGACGNVAFKPSVWNVYTFMGDHIATRDGSSWLET